MSNMKFPTTLHISRDANDESGPIFLAYTDAAQAIDDDGPTAVAEYRLVKVRRLRKHVVDETGRRHG